MLCRLRRFRIPLFLLTIDSVRMFTTVLTDSTRCMEVCVMLFIGKKKLKKKITSVSCLTDMGCKQRVVEDCYDLRNVVWVTYCQYMTDML